MTLNLLALYSKPILAALGFFFWFAKNKLDIRLFGKDLGRRLALLLGVFSVLIISIEYWIFGYSSYLDQATDLLIGLPVHLGLALHHTEGLFTFAPAGGFDVSAMNHNVGQLFSLERFIFRSLPMPASTITLKLIATTCSFSGMYFLCRRGLGTDRVISLIAAAAFAAGFWEILNSTIEQGLGYPLMPWLAYFSIFRHGRRHYWAGVLLVCIIYTTSSTPTHSAPGAAIFILFVAAFEGRQAFLRALIAVIILATLMILNWHDSLYAKYLVLHDSARTVIDNDFQWDEFLLSALRTPRDTLHYFAVFFISTGALFLLQERRKALFSLGMIIFIMLGGTMINQIPFSSVGLEFLQKYNFQYIQHAFYPGTIYITCLAVLAAGDCPLKRVLKPGPTNLKLALSSVLFALAFTNIAWWKLYNATLYLNGGSLAVVKTMSQAAKDIRNDQKGPVRVITLPYYYVPTTPFAVGLESMDGGYAFFNKRVLAFWREAALGNNFGVGFYQPDVDWGCCPSKNFDELANTGLLAQANVGYVLSALPLIGDQLELLAHYNPENIPPDQSVSGLSRYERKFQFALKPSLFVYRVPDSLPRAFGVERVEALPVQTEDIAVIRKLASKAPTRSALIPGLPQNKSSARLTPPTVTDLIVGADEMLISYEAHEDGWIIISQPFSSFWKANVNSADVNIFSANGFQMAVQVPRGTHLLRLEYVRPTFVSKAGGPIRSH